MSAGASKLACILLREFMFPWIQVLYAPSDLCYMLWHIFKAVQLSIHKSQYEINVNISKLETPVPVSHQC